MAGRGTAGQLMERVKGGEDWALARQYSDDWLSG